LLFVLVHLSFPGQRPSGNLSRTPAPKNRFPLMSASHSPWGTSPPVRSVRVAPSYAAKVDAASCRVVLAAAKN
jgi:hypothetical protein